MKRQREVLTVECEELQKKINAIKADRAQQEPCVQQVSAYRLRGGGCAMAMLALKVLVTTIDAQWEGMGDVGSARYEPALLPPCPTIRVLSYSN